MEVKQNEQLRKDVEEAVFNLKINEASFPIKLDQKYYIFILTGITPAKPLSLEEAKDTIYNMITQNKMQKGLKDKLDEIKGRSYVKILPN